MGTTADSLNLTVYLAVTAIAGWLVVGSGFRVSSGDRLLVGPALGVALSTWLANLLGRWIDPPDVFWWAAVGLLAVGLLAWRDHGAFHGPRAGLRSWLLLVGVIGLALVFDRIGSGLAIFDDRKNLSLISLMAAGEIPPPFYMNPDDLFAYHYGFQLYGGALMRVGELFPWTAFDLAKGIAGGLVVGLTVIWGRRAVGRWSGGIWLGAVILLASGTRWLLLALPPSLVAAAGGGVDLWGSAATTASTLAEALRSAWAIEGGPPFPIPFAFVNGILQPFVLHLQTGPGSMGLIALLLIMLLYPARSRRWSWVVLVGVAAFLALAAEAAFVLVTAGAVVAGVVLLVPAASSFRARAPGLFGAIALATALAVLQGGTLTEVARDLLPGARPRAAASVAGFALRSVPAIVSSHLGELRITHSGELLIGVLELGPALMLAPLSVWAMVRGVRRGRVLPLALGISAVLGFVVPIVLRYDVDRDITRLTHHALVVWILLAAGPLGVAWARCGAVWRGAIAAGTAALVLGGVVVTGPLLTAMARPVISDGFAPVDAAMTRAVWNRLAPESLVVDSSPWRAVAVTGRPTRSAVDSQTPLESWRQLVSNPTVDRLVEAGFDYAYVDTFWWEGMDDPARQSFSSPCVSEVAALHDDGANGDRWLFDLRGCR